jgi:hypothetical protein
MKATLLATALAVGSLFAFNANALGHGGGGGGGGHSGGGGGGHFSGGHVGHGFYGHGHGFYGRRFYGYGGWGGWGWYGGGPYYGDWGYGYGGGYDSPDYYGGGDGMYYPQPNPGLATNSLAREVQQSLAMAGFYHGSVDGHLGPLTRNAIGRYQTSHGLPVTQRIDESLLQSLRLL